MSALGDIVHALPVLAAIRDQQPALEVDWLVDTKYAGIFDYVEGVSECILGRPGLSRAVSRLRRRGYDIALDLQGLLKSASMARLSGAARVVGFERSALREKAAAWFYSDAAPIASNAHIVQKNLAVLPRLGMTVPSSPRFPLVVPPSTVADGVSDLVLARRHRGFALVNPGAAWPNKRWPAERFGELAAHLARRHQLLPVVLWGGGEQALAHAVVAASQQTADVAPQTSLGDLLALMSRAAIIVSGDTGPVHMAAALGTPIVGLYGPTWPERNGPWHPDDEVVSKALTCHCHHKRQCLRDDDRSQPSRMCLTEIDVAHVSAAVDLRLTRPSALSRSGQ